MIPAGAETNLMKDPQDQFHPSDHCAHETF